MTRERFLPYNEPEVGEAEVQAVEKAIMARWITRAGLTQQFEEQLAEYLGVEQVVCVSSCTAGLHLALLAAGIGPGDEVITTPYTFAASVNVIIHVGATPVLVDIDEDTANINLDAVRQVMSPRTRAVIPVHYAGHSVDIKEMNRIRDQYGVHIIEDAAHALGSRQDGRLVGSFGNLTAFSFYATKNLTTGEGGALVVPDSSMLERIRVLSLHGLSKNAWSRYSESGSWRYDVEYPGYKYNMTDIEAAMGLVQLQKFRQMQQKRHELAMHYMEALHDLPVILPTVRVGYEHAWHIFPIRVDSERTNTARDRVIDDLRERHIGTSVHFIPIHHHSYYQKTFGWRVGDFPRADHYFAGQISLPLYPTMTHGDVDDVVEALSASLLRTR